MEFALNQAQSIVAGSTVKPNRSEVRLNPNACAAFLFCFCGCWKYAQWVRGEGGRMDSMDTGHIREGPVELHVTRLDAIADWLQFIILSINAGYAAAQRTVCKCLSAPPSSFPSPSALFSLCVWKDVAVCVTVCVCVCIIRKPKVIILSNWWICLFPRQSSDYSQRATPPTTHTQPPQAQL